MGGNHNENGQQKKGSYNTQAPTACSLAVLGLRSRRIRGVHLRIAQPATSPGGAKGRGLGRPNPLYPTITLYTVVVTMLGGPPFNKVRLIVTVR